MGIFLVKKSFRDEQSGADKQSEINAYFKRMLTFSLPIILTYFGMFTLNNQDLVLVKKFFDPVMAGYYAGVVILGKIILFGANSLTIVMFPQIAILKSKGEDYFARFRAIFWLLLLVLISAIGFYTVLPQFIAQTFFGERFLHSAIYLPRFSLFISLYVLINFIFIFLLAIDKIKITLISLPAILAQFILINFYHQNLFQIININISVAAGILVILLFYLYKLSKDTAR
jgi:O-antigen/teichoic acid export membrane protein